MLLFILTQYSIFLLGFCIFLHALIYKKVSIFIFLLIDAFIFEYLILHIYKSVIYNPSLINVLGIPLMIIIGWTVLLYSYIVTVKSQNLLVSSFFMALSLTFVDLVMERPVVNLGLWRWVEPLGYLNIPYKNFFAWFIYSFLVTFFVSRQRTIISYKKLFIIFMQVTVLGLAIGYLWNLLPINFQKYPFWLMISLFSVFVIKNKSEIVFDTSHLYLLLIPICFFLYSFYLIVFNTIHIQSKLIINSLLFMSSWLLLTASIISNTIYESGIRKLQHSSPSSLF